jgi:hypothetical protein
MIKVLDQPLRDLRLIDRDIVLHRDIDLRAGPVMAGQSSETVERLA